MRLHMCQVYVCTAQDMVLCVGQASLRVSCCVVLWLGRCGGLTRKVSSLPTLRGGSSRSRRTSHLDRPPGRPCRESPGLFVLSLSHSSECSRQWVVNPPAQLLWIAPRQHLWAIDVCTRSGRASRCGPTLPQARPHALLNACAASESTVADRS